jgi:hypothetical protein
MCVTLSRGGELVEGYNGNVNGSPREGTRTHGKFLWRGNWLAGSGLRDKAGHWARSFSSFGHDHSFW